MKFFKSRVTYIYVWTRQVACPSHPTSNHLTDLVRRLVTQTRLDNLQFGLTCLTGALSPSSFITLAKNLTTVVPHPLYSPNFTHYDFNLFPKFKLQLKRHHFDNIEAIQTKSQDVFDIFIEADFQKIFEDWKKRWDSRISVVRTTLKNTAISMYKGTYLVSYCTSLRTFG